ncbi:MAG: transcriptional repressor [Elusimicrobiota bacterium]|jgi:Fe2+ or Zn2+ uptake regulation protein|nr:transcriptional repressor [Elusimicrobiota bacterium]
MDKANSRQTLQKSIVFNALHSLKGHLRAEDIFESIHKDFSQISRSTVFRILGELVKQKKLLCLHVPYGALRYDLRTDEHWHFQCKNCMRIFDVPKTKHLQPPKMEEMPNFEVDECSVVYLGLCDKCLAKAKKAK